MYKLCSSLSCLTFVVILYRFLLIIDIPLICPCVVISYIFDDFVWNCSWIALWSVPKGVGTTPQLNLEGSDGHVISVVGFEFTIISIITHQRIKDHNNKMYDFKLLFCIKALNVELVLKGLNSFIVSVLTNSLFCLLFRLCLLNFLFLTFGKNGLSGSLFRLVLIILFLCFCFLRLFSEIFFYFLHSFRWRFACNQFI